MTGQSDSTPEVKNEITLFDLGNSRLKLARVKPGAEGGEIQDVTHVLTSVLASSTASTLSELLETPTFHIEEKCFIVSVAWQATEKLVALLERGGCSVNMLSAADFGLEIDYDDPDRVGVDRLAAAAGVVAHGSGGIVVDAGSAVTVDLVTADGCYKGGAIMPGLSAMAHSMSRDTALLPDLSITDAPPSMPGKTTEECVRVGVYWGWVGAVERLIHIVGDDDMSVHVTGGDGESLSHQLVAAKYDPHLVFTGMMRVVA